MFKEELSKINKKYNSYKFNEMDANELVNSKELVLYLNEITDLFIKELGYFLEKQIKELEV